MVNQGQWSNPVGTLADFAGAAVLPVSLFLGFILFWFLIGPILGWWLYLGNIEVLPDKWAILFWIMMFLVWSFICLGVVMFLKRCGVSLRSPQPEKHPLPLDSVDAHPKGCRKDLTASNTRPVKTNSDILLSRPSSHCGPIPLSNVSHANDILATSWFLENEKESYSIEEPLTLDRYAGLTPREIFFIDLIELAERTTYT